MSLERMQRESEEAEQALEKMLLPPEETPETPDSEQAEPIPEATPAAAPEKAEPDVENHEVASLKAQLDGSKQKFTSLEGRFNALVEQYRELKEAVKQTPAAVEPSAPVAKQAEPDPNDEDYKTLVEEYGDKAAKSIWRMAQKAGGISDDKLVKLVEEKTRPVAEKLESVSKSQAVTAEERFFTNLEAKVPDWKQINGWQNEGLQQDPKFSQFLDERVPFQNYTFNDLLAHSYQQGDVHKVAEIFNTFKGAAGKVDTPPAVKTSGLEQHLEPEKTGKGSPVTTMSNQEIIPKATYEAFYGSITKGTFKGTKEERDKLDAKYEKALLEGRVR